ncbi:hypothetical protein BASA61_001672 [Batrachochytrium salamandrivorans]|nr:hypothetical protein BASA61_001672 [Batrachochytrium salamandrivorans]
MKFNALVVAAMVITSVNAGLWRSTMGCFGHSCRLRSASSQGSLDSDSDESQESEAKTNPICLAIAMQLFALWNDMGILDYRLHNPMQASHDLIENDIKKGKLRAKGMVAYSELNSEDQAKPENIEEGLIDLEQSYRQTWKESGPAVVGRTVEHESMGTRHDNRALAARLADFFQVAYRQYQSTLWKYHRDRLVEVG